MAGCPTWHQGDWGLRLDSKVMVRGFPARRNPSPGPIDCIGCVLVSSRASAFREVCWNTLGHFWVTTT